MVATMNALSTKIVLLQNHANQKIHIYLSHHM